MNSFQISPRVTVRPGDVVRLSQGPRVIPTNARIGPKGKFRIIELFKRRSTVFGVLTAATGEQSDGGTYVCRLTGGKRRHRLCPETIADLPFKLQRSK